MKPEDVKLGVPTIRGMNAEIEELKADVAKLKKAKKKAKKKGPADEPKDAPKDESKPKD